MMKAAVLREFNKPLSLESVPVPTIGETDVLIKVKAVGICQSDLHLWHGSSAEIDKIPLIMGHECAGVIERVGDSVKRIKPRDRVVMDYRITCGECYYCNAGKTNLCDSATDIGANRDGGYAEYVAVPSRQVFPLPEEVTFEEGAITGCAVVTAYHATRRVADLRSDESVAVIGIGGVGYHILKCARALGAGRMIAVDVDDRKLARAARLGAETINPKQEPADKLIKRMTGDEGVDVAFEAIGLPRTIESAIRSAARCGRVVIAGVCTQKVEITPWQDMMFASRIRNSGKEIQVRPSIDHLRTDIQEILELVRQRKVDLSDSITHRLPLDEATRGLEMLDKKTGDLVRIVLLPG